MKYTCSSCGKVRDGWPALGFSSPSYYNDLSDEERQTIAELSDDFCLIGHPERTDRFIRGTLTQRIIDHCEDLSYGLWVSLSGKSYTDYLENFDNDNHQAQYFGWLSNKLPDYEFQESFQTIVSTRTGHNRPEIIPDPDFDHPFVHDYYHGITKVEAERRINEMLRLVADGKTTDELKRTVSWWKFWKK